MQLQRKCAATRSAWVLEPIKGTLAGHPAALPRPPTCPLHAGAGSYLCSLLCCHLPQPRGTGMGGGALQPGLRAGAGGPKEEGAGRKENSTSPAAQGGSWRSFSATCEETPSLGTTPEVQLQCGLSGLLADREMADFFHPMISVTKCLVRWKHLRVQT